MLINRFIEACQSNNFEKAKKIYYHLNTNAQQTALYNALLAAVSTGNIDVVIWLYDMDRISLKPILTYEMMNCLFSKVGQTSNIDLAIFLLETGMVDPHYNEDNPFRTACFFNQVIMAKWMYENIDNINIRAKNDDVFKLGIKHNNTDILKFLILICDSYKIDMIDNIILGYKIDDMYYMI